MASPPHLDLQLSPASIALISICDYINYTVCEHFTGQSLMSGVGSINLKVLVYDGDVYALQAINSYLAWDRRTRVTFMSSNLDNIWQYLQETPPAEQPDIAIVDFDHFDAATIAQEILHEFMTKVPDMAVICMVQRVDVELAEIAADGGARAFLAKADVGIRIAWAVIYAMQQPFTVTPTVARYTRDSLNRRLYNAMLLPDQRDYPEMTDRIRQAIRLCVIEGMPAHLAADEMGISLHTIRGYVKEGYRILESYDQHEYPTDMTPQERAFMRFTALSSHD